jgi:lysyl endopeptidase
MKRLLYALLLVAMGWCAAEAQINIGGTPYSFDKAFSTQRIPVEVMSPLNMTAIEREDKSDDEAGRPPRFGYPLDAGFTLDNSGVWEMLPNGDRLWRLNIHCPGARSINLLYDAFWLPTGATLYIYNADRSHVIGGFTSRNNNSQRGNSIGYATGLVYGEMITLEYYEPQNSEYPGEISIAKVVHGYRHIKLPGEEKAFGTSNACQVNVNCPEGADWQLEKTSVAMILVDGSRWCTGSLLNNTTTDFTPYFLTADHCLSGWAIPTALDAGANPNASVWTFYWNYESPGCDNPLTEPGFQSTTGAIVVANAGGSDFALLRLTEDPLIDAGMGLLYNGWDTGDPPGGGVGIHHPDGDIKKISIDENTISSNWFPLFWTGGGFSWPFTHWVVDWETGGTEGGSSGSPLFDTNHRVIGQLHGGSGTCDGETSYYGRLSSSWTGDNPQRRLSDWLAPKCIPDIVVTTDVTIGAPTYYADNTVTSNRLITGGVTYVVYNGGDEVILTDGFTVNGGANFIARNFDCGGGSALSDLESRSSEGEALDAVHPKETWQRPEPAPEKVSKPAQSIAQPQPGRLSAAPNPFSTTTTIRYHLSNDAQVTLRVFDLTGQALYTLTDDYQYAGDYEVTLPSGSLAKGTYLCTLTTDQGTEVLRLVVQ